MLSSIKSAVHGLMLCALLSFGVIPGVTAAPRPFIIDTDVGVDDIVAILYVLQRPDIVVKAVTIAADGNAHCRPALANTLGLLQKMGQANIPVACGQEKPLIASHRFPDFVLEESDTLAHTAQLLPEVRVKSRHNAVDLMIHTLRNSPEPVTILAIGPLTNLAQVLQKDPEIKKKIRIIYIMGGAIDVPGNIPEVAPDIHNEAAEWNFYLDPHAARMVLSRNIPVVLISLDTTNQIPVDMAFYHAIKAMRPAPGTDYVFALLHNGMSMIRDNSWFFWDPLAAVIASDESIATFKTRRISVLLAPESRSGATVVDNRHGYDVRVADTVDKPAFERLLLRYLNQPVGKV
ncbi:nucleoside hydrolase [Legionella spiritensis]|uniref:Inosine-uridine preferring nucleoside hydrolase n=1 Tax=Legionella spiritensis TaxID=452 RepID=A0A0W0Z6V5_LEGSP|nr:nucleoside hydrolase [Legionella spiritensis]KTD64849.1 inosine-uridine preferring nucleoside hydrolase [Legionella spiritensis]SNV40872.1 inosine-uridine preferring nucleoside hydrolase [Legionella spiritensis]